MATRQMGLVRGLWALLLLWVLAVMSLTIIGASAQSNPYRAQGNYSKIIQRSLRHPPVQHASSCKQTFGPWPPTIPKGSLPFYDGQHGNFSQLVVIFTGSNISGLRGSYLDTADGKTESTFFQHGASSGAWNATVDLTAGNSTVFRQIGGSFLKNNGSLTSITLVDSSQNQYQWGRMDNGTVQFLSPENEGYIVGLFGAATDSAVTQIGICVTPGP